MWSPLASFKVITFSPSFTLPVTQACFNHCLYCGFRDGSDGLMDMDEVVSTLERARQMGVSEVLIMAGERAGNIPPIRDKVRQLDFADFVDYVAAVCRIALGKSLLPHTNIGILNESELIRLRECNASMGLMLENSDPHFGKSIHPQKDIAPRIQTIALAGRLKIPFTTGILVGLGEPKASRFASLQCIADLHREFGHIQEIIIQNYVPNEKSTLAEYPLFPLDWEELLFFAKQNIPGVKIQIPPNLNPYWLDLISCGADDLGGISSEKDWVNPGNPWRAPSFYAKELKARGFSLSPRLPLYKKYYQNGWYSPAVREPLNHWVNRHEFRYYRQ